MNMKKIKIEQIKTDEFPRVRVATDVDTIIDYAEDMKKGDDFPAIVVFERKGSYILADGLHRLEAAKRAGLDVIKAEVRQGDRKAALDYALSERGQAECCSDRNEGIRYTQQSPDRGALSRRRRPGRRCSSGA
jgi:ParB-like chromosome segregation protein Spo0J